MKFIVHLGNQCSKLIKNVDDCNQSNERSGLSRCGDQHQHFGDNHATWLLY